MYFAQKSLERMDQWEKIISCYKIILFVKIAASRYLGNSKKTTLSATVEYIL